MSEDKGRLIEAAGYVDSTAPVVTVIVPFYQAAKTLDACIESIVAQSFPGWELVLVDDGSTDGGLAIARAWGRRDTRIRVAHQENEGRSAARNSGIEAACGTWICFVDADDTLNANALAELLASAEDGIDAVWAGFTDALDVSHCVPGTDMMVGACELARLVMGLPIDQEIGAGEEYALFRSVWAKLYRTELVKSRSIRFERGLRFGEDALFNIAFARHVGHAVLVGKAIYRYDTEHSGMATAFSFRDGDCLLAFARAARCGIGGVDGRAGDTACVAKAEVERFIGGEAAMVLRRAGGCAADIGKAAKALSLAYRDRGIRRALAKYEPAGAGARMLHAVRRVLVGCGALWPALALERFAYRRTMTRQRAEARRGGLPQ